MTELHTVAVYQLGTRLRVLVDGLPGTPEEASKAALQTVLDLARVPRAAIGLRVARTDLVTDCDDQAIEPPPPHP